MLTERLELNRTTPTRLKAAIGELIVRVQGEYHEMPGLKLTEVQAQRLWGLNHRMCAMVLTTLVEQQFLRRTAAGTYVRMSDSPPLPFPRKRYWTSSGSVGNTP